MNPLIQRLMAFTGDGVCRSALDDDRILLANRGLLRILDLEGAPESLVGRRLQECLREVEPAHSTRARLLERGELHDFPYHFQTLKGEDRWVIYNAVLVTDPDTGARVIEALLKDITALKRAEAALAEETERLAITLQSISDGVIATDTRCRIRFMNQAAAQLTGWPEAEARDRPLGEVFRILDEETRQPAPDPVAGVLASGQVVALTNHAALLARDGMERSIADSAAPIRDAQGYVTGVVLVFRDVSVQRRLQAALRLEHEELRVIFHSNPAMIFYKDTENRMLRVNEAFAAACGLPRAAIEGKSCLELFPGQAAGYWADDREVIASGQLKAGVIERLQTVAGPIWVQTVKVPYRDAAGRITGVIGFAQDITARRTAEEAQMRLTQELRRANQDLERLIHIASHDLRSPLVNIQGFSRILERACAELKQTVADAALPDERRRAAAASEEKLTRALHFILAGVTKMNGLIGGLVRLSRLGHEPLAKQPVDMDALLKTLLEAIAFQVRAAGAEVTVEPLPACRGDPSLLGQVFSNLLDNALKYRAADRPPRIVVQGWREAGRVLYCVADNGLGVAPDACARIWQLFYRVNPQGDVTGDGVGLAAVRRIVHRHGGSVWLEANKPHGSRFCLVLPADEEAPS